MTLMKILVGLVLLATLVILFTGALDNMVRMPLEKLFLMFRRKRPDEATTSATEKPAE